MLLRRRYLVLPLLLLGLSGQPAHAQQAQPVQRIVPADLPLPIAPPPVGKVTLEVDARDNDILGLLKDLIRSVKTAPAASVPPAASPPAKAASGSENGFFQIIQQLELDEVLKGISHLHVITIELPAPASAASERPLDAKSDLTGYYEKIFQKEDAHRVLWSDKGSTRILMMASDAPRRNFSVVIQSGKNVTVVRADGYPNVEKLTKLFGLLY